MPETSDHTHLAMRKPNLFIRRDEFGQSNHKTMSQTVERPADIKDPAQDTIWNFPFYIFRTLWTTGNKQQSPSGWATALPTATQGPSGQESIVPSLRKARAIYLCAEAVFRCL